VNLVLAASGTTSTRCARASQTLSIPVVASGGAGLPDASSQGVEGCAVSSVARLRHQTSSSEWTDDYMTAWAGQNLLIHNLTNPAVATIGDIDNIAR